MSDFESALVTTILDNRDIRQVINNKITADYFSQAPTRAAYQYLLAWFTNPKYGDTPSWETFADSFPTFEPVRMEESVQALVDKLREQKLYGDIGGLVVHIADLARGDASAAFAELKQRVAELAAAHTVDEALDIRSRVEMLKQEYLDMKSGVTGGLKGRPWPWDALNQSTLGLRDQQLVFFYGRPKSGKTWCLLKSAQHFHKHGAKPLIFSQELPDTELCRRYVALVTEVDYNLYLRGRLPEHEERDFMENLDAFVETPPVIVSRLTSTGAACLTELSAKIDEYRADVVFIDGVYFLGEDWKELATVTRGLKNLAKAKRIPIVGATQANRSRGKKGDSQDGADDFAYGDSFYQDCDVAIRVTSDIENKKRRDIGLFTAAIRDGQSTAFTINMRPAFDMAQKSVESLGDPENSLDDEVEQDKLDGESDLPDQES